MPAGDVAASVKQNSGMLMSDSRRIPTPSSTRASTSGKKRRSTLEHPGRSAFVSSEGACLPAGGVAASVQQMSCIVNCLHSCGTPKQTTFHPDPETTLRSESGVSYRFSDCSMEYDEDPPRTPTEEKDRKWFPTPKRREVMRTTKENKQPCSSSVTPEMVQRVLVSNPIIANKSPAEDQACLLLPEVVQTATKLCYNKDAPLRVKVGGPIGLEDIFREFRENYAPKMNLSASRLRKMTFPSFELACTVLRQMIRSFIPNFTANIKEKRKTKKGSTMTLECCTSKHVSKRDTEGANEDGGDVTREVCRWKAKIVTTDDETYSFSRIDSFLDHKIQCIEKICRFGSTEISFQAELPNSSRSKIMSVLNQTAANQETFTRKKNRERCYVERIINQRVVELVSKQDIDWTVTNIDEATKKRGIPEETERILKFLSFIKDQDKARAFFEIKSPDPTRASIYLMWPLGQKLLETHSDVVYCDSMWDATKDSDRLLTIVVKDKNNKLRLAAMGLVTSEDTAIWGNFFTWVKKCVPEFCPKCFISDDASYIHSAFSQCVTPSAQHLVCWWHKHTGVEDGHDSPKVKFYAERILSLAFGDSEQEIDEKSEKLKNEIINDKKLPKDKKQRLLALLENRKDQAFVKLKVFTGGTITNSNAESINHLLRQFGLKSKKEERITVINLLREFCKKQQQPDNMPFKPSSELLRIMELEVLHKISNGVLNQQKDMVRRLVFNEIKSCSVVCKTEHNATVRERIDIVTCKRRGSTQLSRYAVWNVAWQEDHQVYCTCNRLVYGGMPCKHVLRAALDAGFKISTLSFNPRFFDDEKESVSPILSLTQQAMEPQEVPTSLSDFEVVTMNPSAGDRTKHIRDLLHIHNTLHAGKHNDPQSIAVLARFRALEEDGLRLLQCTKNQAEIVSMIESLHKEVRKRLLEEYAANPPLCIMEHARGRSSKNSWKEYPKQLAQEQQRMWEDAWIKDIVEKLARR